MLKRISIKNKYFIQQRDNKGHIISTRRWSPKTFTMQDAVNDVKQKGTIKIGAIRRHRLVNVNENEVKFNKKYLPKNKNTVFSVQASVFFNGEKFMGRSMSSDSRDLEDKHDDALNNLANIISNYDEDDAVVENIKDSIRPDVKYSIIYYSK